MSSSSSSGFSDEDTEASTLSVAAPSASQLSNIIELAQICSFCATFRKPLHLPSFSRTELQEALLGASNGDTTHMELLAELHFKLAREHPTAKMEKMVQDWEKTLARKLQDNWRKEFTANPMGGRVTYQDLTVFERVNILNALCHWKLDTCTEIHNHIAMLQKENNDEALTNLRTGEIGTDDKGVSYWYFGDECWVYAEDKPRWQLEKRKPSYLVEFASAKKIRLSINFDPDHNSSAPPLRLPLKQTALITENKQEKKEEAHTGEVKDEKQNVLSAKIKDDVYSSEAVKLETELSTVTLVKTEKVEAPSSLVVEAAGLVTERTTAVVKDVTVETPTFRKSDISVLSGSSEQEKWKQDGVLSTGLLLSNMAEHEQYGEGLSATEGADSVNVAQITASKHPASGTNSPQFAAEGAATVKLAQISAAKDPAAGINSPQFAAKAQSHSEILPSNNDKMDKSGSEKNDSSERLGKRTSVMVDEDSVDNHAQPCVVAVIRAKKRTIIDDDSSDSSSSDTDTLKAAADKTVYQLTASSPPSRKKHKASTEPSCRVAVLDVKTTEGNSTMLGSTQANGTATLEASKSDFVTSRIKEAMPSLLNADPVAFDLIKTRSPQLDVLKPAALHMEEPSSLSRRNEDNDMVLKSKSTEAKVTGNVVDAANPSGATSMSPTDPAAAPETFDITCESCKKCYDMRYLDPPLVERPSDEWRCFECLVNDARGWPRRRKPTARKTFSPRGDNRVVEPLYRKRSSSSKFQSGSSALKRSKTSSKSRSSSTLKTRSNDSSSSKRRSKRSSSKKSSSSSSKKHKKHKSSSSSRHRHGSSHSHHRRRHSHHHHEEFAKLVKSFRERQEQRLGIEDARMNGKLQVDFDEGPQGWRVASSTPDGVRALIQSLSGGSLEQDRLRGRLILIVKDHEKLEEQRRKQQELAWNILPRRQSSRIAIGRMKNQSAQDSDAEEGYSGDDVESRRPGLRLKRPHAASEVVDGKQKHDRAWRARRRRNNSDDDMHFDNEEDEVDSSGTGNWIDWSEFKRNGRCLSAVCLAVVNRLLKEEVSDLFSRPVDPEIDGCPNYLSVIDQPMDLGTIRSRAEANFYRKWKLFKKDVELVWQNCRTFNAPDTMVVQFANLLERLSRSMCIAAEKKGVDRLSGKGGGGDEIDESENSLSDASKAGSRNSVNKAWTESSASESRDSSDDGASPHGDNDGDARSHKRRSTRVPAKNLRTRARSMRPSGTSSQARRNTRSRSSRKRQSPTSSSEKSSASDDDAHSSLRRSRRQRKGLSSKVDHKVDPFTEDEDSSDDDSANNQPPPPRNNAPSPSPSPPPPPPPQTVQKRSKPRLIISDSSNSDDSSDSDDSSSSSSSDSADSDSDTLPANKYPHPSPPSSADAPAPPPPSPPPPATLSENDKAVQSSPNHKAKLKSAAGEAKKTKLESTGKDGCTHSPPLLNSYLSPSSSSSSDFSSDDSDSSDDGDST
ncbi:unnamed protein product [Peronospora farinosa]|uniref:Bromo domain-containing protein n=1 Tax=Peronospora farinosa TaxID=134698 RepID=A0AAV0UFG3_9STRA|nr:unnamed protein product [Peronospora farinosa]